LKGKGEKGGKKKGEEEARIVPPSSPHIVVRLLDRPILRGKNRKGKMIKRRKEGRGKRRGVVREVVLLVSEDIIAIGKRGEALEKRKKGSEKKRRERRKNKKGREEETRYIIHPS